MELAVAPALRTLQVYKAPNDYTGQTELDEYTTIANQDTAATDQLELGSLRERRRRRLRAGREHDLRADGPPGPVDVQLGR